MARIWSCGFELNSSTSGVEFDTNGAATVSTSVVRSGTYALRANANTSVAYFVHTFQNDTINTTYHRGYIYIDTLPASEISIFQYLDSASAVGFSLRLAASGTVQAYNDAGAQTAGSASSALSTGTWYRLEVKIVDDADVAAQMEFKIDGMTISTATGLAGLNAGGQIRWGACATNSSALLYFDDIAVNDTTGSAQTGYPGAGSIVHLRPNGAGDNNDASSGTYADIDEVTPDDATTVAILDANNDILDVTVDDPPFGSSATVNLVQVGIREKAFTAAAESWQLRIKSASGGTVATGTTTQHNDTTFRTNGDTSPRVYTLTSYTDPTTGSAWTPTGTNSLTNMQIGVIAIDATPDIYVTAMWALVDYIPGAGSPSSSLSPSASASPSLSPSASRSPSASLSPSASVSPSSSSSASLSPSASSSPSLSPSASLSPSSSISASISPSASSSLSVSPSASISPSSSVSPSISPSSSTSPSSSASASVSPSASISPSASTSPSSSASPSLSPSASRSPSASISPSISPSSSLSPSPVSSTSPSSSSSASRSPSASLSPSSSASASLSPSASSSLSTSPSSSASASISPSASSSLSLSPSASFSASTSPSSSRSPSASASLSMSPSASNSPSASESISASPSSSTSASISPSGSISLSVSPSSSASRSISASPSPSPAFDLPQSLVTAVQIEDTITAVSPPVTSLTIVDG